MSNIHAHWGFFLINSETLISASENEDTRAISDDVHQRSFNINKYTGWTEAEVSWKLLCFHLMAAFTQQQNTNHTKHGFVHTKFSYETEVTPLNFQDYSWIFRVSSVKLCRGVQFNIQHMQYIASGRHRK